MDTVVRGLSCFLIWIYRSYFPNVGDQLVDHLLVEPLNARDGGRSRGCRVIGHVGALPARRLRRAPRTPARMVCLALTAAGVRCGGRNGWERKSDEGGGGVCARARGHRRSVAQTRSSINMDGGDAELLC